MGASGTARYHHWSRRRFVQAAALTPLLLGLQGESATAHQAASCAPHQPPGPVGVVAGQLVQVSLFRHAVGQGDELSSVVIRLRRPDGTVVAAAKEELAPGTGVVREFRNLATGPRLANRVQLHVEVELDQVVPVGGTVAVLDEQTLTPVVLQPPAFRPAWSGMGSGLVGVTGSQLLRLSLFEAGGSYEPCPFVVRLLGLDGQVLGEHKGMLAPQTGTLFDFDIAAGLTPREVRYAHVMVYTPVDAQLNRFVIGSTLEVVDAKRGGTVYPTIPCNLPLELAH